MNMNYRWFVYMGHCNKSEESRRMMLPPDPFAPSTRSHPPTPCSCVTSRRCGGAGPLNSRCAASRVICLALLSKR